MSKMITIIAILGATLILYHFAGIIPDTTTSELLSLITNPQNFLTSAFWTNIITSVGIGIIGALVVGFFVSGTLVEKFGLAFMTFLIGILVTDLYKIFLELRISWGGNEIFATLTIGLLIVLSVVQAVEWGRGFSG